MNGFHAPLLQLVQAAEQALIDHPDTHSVDRVVLVPGGRATWDDSCSGQLWVRLSNILPLPSSPSPCRLEARQATIHLGIVRCIATVNERGRPPTAVEVTADGITALSDAAVLLDFLTELDPLSVGLGTLTVTNWEPLGPLGGYAGGEWTIRAVL